MRIQELKQLQQRDYLKNNNLEQSYITQNVLWQCRPLLPEVNIVGKDRYHNVIFFEETSGSLQRRHYGKSEEATSFNLLYNDGFKTYKMTKDYLKNNQIMFNTGYDLNLLINFLENNNHRFNALKDEKKKVYQYRLSEEENELVKEFIKKMRAFRNEK